MPPGGARNAVDCALWELEANRAGVPVWQLAGQSSPRALRTTFTLGADTPDVMAQGAVNYAEAARSRSSSPAIWTSIARGYGPSAPRGLMSGWEWTGTRALRRPISDR
jgi:hypothetical protein